MPRKTQKRTAAVLLCQPAVVVQILLQVSERTLDLVVRVGHPFAAFPLEGKEVWQMEVKAVHRSSQPSVRIVQLPVLMEALVANRGLPLFLPFLIVLLEVSLVSPVKPGSQVFQFPAGQHLGIQREIAPDYLLHMELTHLYRIG